MSVRTGSKWARASLVGTTALTLILWASVYSAIKVGLEGFTVWHLAFLRLVVASIVLGAYAALARIPLPPLRHFPALAAIGLIGFAVYQILLITGQRDVEAGTASFIINATPALSALLAVIFLRERLTPAGFAGIAISFCGVAVIIGAGPGLGFSYSPGALILACAALAHAAHFVLKKAALNEVSPFQVTLISIWTGTIFLLPAAPGAFDALVRAPTDAIAAMLYLGIFTSALAYLTWAYVLAVMPAAVATSLLALIPPLAVVIGAIWLGELPTIMAFCGGALAIVGVALVQAGGRLKAG